MTPSPPPAGTTPTTVGPASDAELIAAVRAGDVSAYGDLFARHVDAARRLARQLTTPGDADDLVSDAFAKVLTVLQRGDGPDLAFRAYLLTAVRRLHVDRIRAGARLHTTDDLTPYDPGVPFHDTTVEGFENAAAARAFASLPERWQAVLWHTEVEGQKPAEVAPLLGMSANSVAALAYRAREGLRQAFLSMHAQDAETDACRWTRANLGAYVRGGASKRDRARLEEHLAECRPCAAIALELAEVNSGLGALLAPLVLGGAAAAYLGSGAAGGAGAALSGGVLASVGTLLGRARDAVAANGPAAAAAGVAAAAVVAVGVVVTQGADAPGSADRPAAGSSAGGGPGAARRDQRRSQDASGARAGAAPSGASSDAAGRGGAGAPGDTGDTGDSRGPGGASDGGGGAPASAPPPPPGPEAGPEPDSSGPGGQPGSPRPQLAASASPTGDVVWLVEVNVQSSRAGTMAVRSDRPEAGLTLDRGCQPVHASEGSCRVPAGRTSYAFRVLPAPGGPTTLTFTVDGRSTQVVVGR